MDPMAGLLEGPRARGAFLLHSVLEPPWSLAIRDEAPLTLVTVLEGTAWLLPDDGEPVRLDPGDVSLVRGPAPYVVADDPGTPPTVVIGPDQRCTTIAGEPMEMLGVRTWGNATDGATRLLTGTYQGPSELGQRLLRALPTIAVLRVDDWESPLVGLLASEIQRDEPGQEAVLDRLLDLLLIAVLRAWFARPDGGAPAWYRSRSDPLVGPALALLHERPADPWTVATLARATSVSRATLARRFAELVGEPPMRYLTQLRLTLAADLLREPGATITAVARQVGYGSPFALSAAFKRERGVSPTAHRATA